MRGDFHAEPVCPTAPELGYSWWNRGAPWLIFLLGYLTFFIVAFWVYDMRSLRNKIVTVGVIWVIAIVSLILFIPVLHWI